MLKYWSILAKVFSSLSEKEGEYFCTDYTSCCSCVQKCFTNRNNDRARKREEMKQIRIVGVKTEWKVCRVLCKSWLPQGFEQRNTKKNYYSRFSKKFWRKYFENSFVNDAAFQVPIAHYTSQASISLCVFFSLRPFDAQTKRVPWNIIKVHSQIIDVHKKWWQMQCLHSLKRAKTMLHEYKWFYCNVWRQIISIFHRFLEQMHKVTLYSTCQRHNNKKEIQIYKYIWCSCEWNKTCLMILKMISI